VGVISTAMATWRNALAASPASLTNLPQNVSINDPPDADKTYFAVLPGFTGGGPLEPEAGAGALYGDSVHVRVVVDWMKDIDDEALGGTIIDDIQNVQTVMLDEGNKGTSVVLIEPLGWTLEEMDGGQWTQGTINYRVRFRVSADLS